MNLNKIFQNHKPKLIGLKKEYSVMILLTEINDEKHIIFEKRGKNISQPGEVSLPGGRVEENENSLHTAKRETFEELGISVDEIDIIAELGYLYEFGNDIVRVYIGEVKDFKLGDFIKNDEVEYVFTYPLSYFIENKPKVYNYEIEKRFDNGFPFELIPNGKEYQFKEINKEIYFYEDTEPLIWGITAKIISKFIDICEGD